MSDVIAPQKTVTFTITEQPKRDADKKTIQRLMRMQPHVQKGLRKLATKRRLHDNHTYIRAGVEWVNRKKTTKLVRPDKGESFTLFVTPQIIPDIRSVEKFLDAKAG
ncbi:MAG: hypothetical protein AAF432_04890 [Planctomycetota bacterium]